MPHCDPTSPADRVTIGVYVTVEPDRLHATLASIAANTTVPHDVVLLADGPDDGMRRTLDALPHLERSETGDARGAAACFNRLALHDAARVIVFLEAGAVVAPSWLDRLLAALDADAHNGIAGPSTNQAWNEQRAFPEGHGTLDDVARTGARAAERFGDALRTLEPLYSLADFCLAVRREVLDSVGAADEEYGLGPCWEMDYHVRAARAGWRGVWACGAYVFRAPFTGRRRADESRLFDRNRRLYQDRYCGARLRGEKDDYRTHCRGDACPNFAPADRIVVARPLRLDAPAPARTFSVEDDPLVTCIMPTRNRREFIVDAIEIFLRQDYAKRELVIVDDGEDPVADLVPSDPRIRYARVSGPRTVGAKRNLACELARGEIIVHCDDDDWYPSWRVTAQVRTLQRSGADLCGTSTLYFVDRERQRAWHYRYRSATPWLAGATLGYTREFWSRNRFTARNVGEDSELLWRHVPKRIHDLAEPRLCIASIHGGNTGTHDTAGAFWHPHSIDELERLQLEDEDVPLVSCIVPTFNRRAFIPRALGLFAAQDHPRRELVIVDDGDDAIGDLVTGVAGVRYIRLESRRSIGGKRNLACARARGSIIAHWDDDDWYAPSRLSVQIAPIVENIADLTGLAATCVHDSGSGEFWTITRDLHRRAFAGDVHGGTLVYRRSILRDGLAYPEVNLAEDAWLLRTATARGRRLLRIENDTLFVYTRHTTNAWREFVPGSIDAAGWNPTHPPSGFVSVRI